MSKDVQQLRKIFRKELEKNPEKTLAQMPKKWVNVDLADANLGLVFLAYINLIGWENKEEGISPVIAIEDLVKLNIHFRTRNGCNWARSDTSPLGKRYQISRIKLKRRIEYVQLIGLNNKEKNHNIRKDILNEVSKKPCVVLAINQNIEVDHKNARYNNLKVMNSKTQNVDDFQPMSKAVNDAKRQHCKNCAKAGKRFDARVLGFSVGWINGNENYIDSPDGCVGCYWHDPQKFCAEISKNYHS